MYSSQLKRGQNYDELNKVIVIFIMDFDLFDDIKESHTIWKMTEKQNTSKTFDELELHFIELPKFLASKYDKKKKLDQWLLFIDYSQKEMLKSIMNENEVVKEADEELKKLQMEEYLQEIEIRERLNEVERRHNEKVAREKEEKRIKEAEERVTEQVTAQVTKANKIETAKRMLKNNIDIKIIEIATEMTEEEIEKLRESI